MFERKGGKTRKLAWLSLWSERIARRDEPWLRYLFLPGRRNRDLSFSFGYWSAMLGSISGQREEEAQHPHEPPFGLLLRLVRALFRPLPRRFSPFFNAPLTNSVGLKAARRRYPFLSLAIFHSSSFSASLSLSLSCLETLLSNPRFSARVFPSLRERTRVWLITWSSDICADRKLRTSLWRVSREREREKFSPLFDPYHPFHLTLGVTMCFSNLASSHERLNEFRET